MHVVTLQKANSRTLVTSASTGPHAELGPSVTADQAVALVLIFHESEFIRPQSNYPSWVWDAQQQLADTPVARPPIIAKTVDIQVVHSVYQETVG